MPAVQQAPAGLAVYGTRPCDGCHNSSRRCACRSERWRVGVGVCGWGFGGRWRLGLGLWLRGRRWRLEDGTDLGGWPVVVVSGGGAPPKVTGRRPWEVRSEEGSVGRHE